MDTKCPNISEVSVAKIYLYIFIAEPKRVGSEGANTAKVSKQKDNCVFYLETAGCRTRSVPTPVKVLSPLRLKHPNLIGMFFHILNIEGFYED